MNEDVLTQEEEKLIENISRVQEKNRSEGLKTALEKEATKAAIIEKASELEDYHIEPQQMTKEDHLLVDMQKLVGLDNSIAGKEGEEDSIWIDINSFKKEKGFDLLLDKIVSDKSDLRKQFNLLKKDIALRAEKIWAKTKNVDPCLGVKVTMRKNRELDVELEKAIDWCVENGHQSLLLLNEEKYADLLETGVMKDQPGEVDNSKVPAVKISLKPFVVNE